MSDNKAGFTRRGVLQAGTAAGAVAAVSWGAPLAGTAAAETAPAADWSGASWISHPVVEPSLDGASWIWHAADASAPGKVERAFRGGFTAPDGASGGTLLFSGDDAVDVYLNGELLGSTRAMQARNTFAWQVGQLVDLTGKVKAGRNVLAVRGVNSGSSAAVIARVEVRGADGGAVQGVDTGAEWRSAADAPDGWEAPGFDDSAWPKVKVLGAYGISPWKTNVRIPRTPVEFRRGFRARKPVRSAVLHVSALGTYEARLNGSKVGDEELSPGWVDFAHKVPYQTHDVTRLIRSGANEIGATVAEGYYASILMGGQHRFADSMAFLAELVVHYRDGSTDRIVTGSDWKAGHGPLTRATLYDGEEYDARRAALPVTGPVKVRSDLSPRLYELDHAPVRVIGTVKARSVTALPGGVHRIDFGRNFAGRVRMTATGPAGTRVQLKHAEWLNADGTTYFANLRGADQRDIVTLAGARRPERYVPRFTSHGFRYVEVTGYPGTPTVDDFVAEQLSADTPVTGAFSTSNADLNALQTALFAGQRSNFTVLPTDCPQRDERLGWAGDVLGFAPTAAYNADVDAYLRSWVTSLREAQQEDGSVPSIAPRVYDGANGGAGVSGWGDAIIFVPWTLYERYADRRVLTENYAAMAKWVAFLQTDSTGLLRPPTAYGDWLAVDTSPKEVVNTAYFAHSVRLLAKIARVLGQTADAARYDALLDKIKDAFIAAYVSADGTVRGDTQAVYVLALQFGLMPDALREKAAERLVAKVTAAGFHLSTGYLATPYLLDVLTEAGHLDVAYKVLLNDSYPGWLYMLRQGGTTLWERWDSLQPDGVYQRSSFNHHALGAVGDWMYRTIAGINPDEARPGYRHSVIRPLPGGGLTSAQGSLRTGYGELSSAWRVTGSTLRLTVKVPRRTTATVRLPAGATGPGGRKPDRTENGTAVFEVRSGTSAFTAPAP
ncbi:alpha-L-rhamnosidase [Spirillospora sp. NBC_01491]|uniref:alpha-L-rhamnosidase n=1 Tax=Spirillospora sp. NBC_01491 TaxID=2976007 RepID=UPI002E371414|nr:family 78 glycoside hydrolase catalytic domain [Spirillospora sp. NBC_01491]